MCSVFLPVLLPSSSRCLEQNNTCCLPKGNEAMVWSICDLLDAEVIVGLTNLCSAYITRDGIWYLSYIESSESNFCYTLKFIYPVISAVKSSCSLHYTKSFCSVFCNLLRNWLKRNEAMGCIMHNSFEYVSCFNFVVIAFWESLLRVCTGDGRIIKHRKIFSYHVPTF